MVSVEKLPEKCNGHGEHFSPGNIMEKKAEYNRKGNTIK